MKRRQDAMQEILVEYQRVMRERLGVEDGIAQRAANELLLVFQRRFGGAELYVPRPKRWDEEAVLQSFNGANAKEVMRSHGIPRESFYRLLRRRQRQTQQDQKQKNKSTSKTLRKESDFTW